MHENAEEEVTDVTEVFDFLEEILEYNRIGRERPFFNERDFMNWVVARAGQLYIKFVVEPECIKSAHHSC